jgi:hypothetical protein
MVVVFEDFCKLKAVEGSLSNALKIAPRDPEVVEEVKSSNRQKTDCKKSLSSDVRSAGYPWKVMLLHARIADAIC